ncbi:MAG: hypothetical protein ACI4GY_07740, partial [Acutalibacteraceae bacterium]
MKKVISLILSIIMLMSAAMLPTWAATSTKKAATSTAVTPTTYIAKTNYKTDRGHVDKKYFVYDNGQKIIYENSKFDDSYEYFLFEPLSYVRGDLIYYGFNAMSGNKKCQYLCSSDVTKVSGKSRKVLYKGKSDINVIGGYGQSIFFKEGKQVKKYYKGKISNVF